MSHDYGGPNIYQIIKHQQLGIGIWHRKFMGKIKIWTMFNHSLLFGIGLQKHMD